MFSNCALKLFYDQGGVDAASLAEIQDMSDVEYKALMEPQKGKGVLICETEVVLFDVTMDKDNVLYEKLTTNFHEQSNVASTGDQTDEEADKIGNKRKAAKHRK